MMETNKTSAYLFNVSVANGELIKRYLTIDDLSKLIFEEGNKKTYLVNNHVFDFDIIRVEPRQNNDTQCFEYLFDFILFNLDVFNALKTNNVNLDALPDEFHNALDLFFARAQKLEIVDSDYAPIYSHIIKTVRAYDVRHFALSKLKIYAAIEQYLDFNQEQQDYYAFDPDCSKKIVVFISDYLNIFHQRISVDDDCNSLLEIIKKSSIEIGRYLKNHNSTKDDERLYYCHKESYKSDVTYYSKLIGEITNCFCLIKSKVLICAFEYGDVDDAQELLGFRFDRLLCDELYSMILEFLKSNVIIDNFYDSFDLNFLCNLIFVYCEQMLSGSVIFGDRKILSERHNEKESKQILKFYYLSTFFGNKVANSLNLHLIRLNRISETPYNAIAGFNANLPSLKKQNRKFIENKLLIKNKDAIGILEKTNIGKHNVFETALYNKTLMDYYPIFNGMEYTPVIVNLFKGAEELCAELLKLLRVDRIKNIDNLKDFNKPFKNFTFLDDGWENELTIGNLEKIIDFLNSGDGGPAVSQYKGIYDREYAHYFSKRKQMLIDFMSEHSVKLNIDYTKIQNANTSSNLLYETFDVWRDKCRNNRVHKDNTLQKEPVEAIFEFTYIVIAMLLEWEYLLENK